MVDIKSLTISNIQYLTDDELEDVKAILKAIQPEKVLLNSGIKVQPIHPALDRFKTKNLIFIRNLIDNQEDERLISTVYGVKDFTQCNYFSFASSMKWILSEVERIEKNESRLNVGKDKDLWKAAGIEKLQAYGRYVSVFMMAGNIGEENEILETPYYRVFDRMEIAKDWADIQNKFNEIKFRVK